MNKDTYIKWLEQTLQDALETIQGFFNSWGTNSRWAKNMEDEFKKRKAEFEEGK